MATTAPWLLVGSGAVTAASFLGPGLITKAAGRVRGAVNVVVSAVERERLGLPSGYVLPGERPFPINPKPSYEFKPTNIYDPFGTGWASRDVFTERAVERQAAFMKELERIEESKDVIGSRFALRDVTVFTPPKEQPSSGAGKVETTFQQVTKQQEKTISEAEKIQQELDKDTARITREQEILRRQELVPKQEEFFLFPMATEEKPTAAAGSYSGSRPLGLYGGYVANLTNLGLGGITGAERIKAREKVNQELQQFLVTPQGYNSIAKQYIDQFVSPVTGGKLETSPLSVTRLSNPLVSRVDITPFSSLLTTPITFPLMTPISSPMTMSLETASLKAASLLSTPMSFPSFTPTGMPTRTTPPTPEPTRTPRLPPGLLPSVGTYGRKRRREQYPRFYKKGLTLWKVPPLLNVNVRALNKIFGLEEPKGRKGRR